MHAESFTQIAAVLALAVFAGFVATRLKQPIIMAFILVGVVAGPSGFGWIRGEEETQVALLSALGIAVLLFLVGLKLDLNLVRAIGPVAAVTGLAQIAFSFVTGFAALSLFGADLTTSVYVALALTFSSTIIVVKLLSDTRELDRLHGRIAVGLLIVQDLVVIAAMIVISALSSGGDGSVLAQFGFVAVKALGFVLAAVLAIKWVLPWALPRLATSRELLVLFSIAWAVAAAAAAEQLELSMEVGAFVAGFTLASTPFREAIGSRLVSLRDFLTLFFFIQLGSQVDLRDPLRDLAEAVVLSALVLVGKPLVMLVVMRRMGYPTKVSFAAGITIAQISEFSLILLSLGIAVGHLEADVLGLVTLVGVITIGVSTYLTLAKDRLREGLGRFLAVFEPKTPKAMPTPDEAEYDVVVVGAGRYGRVVTEKLSETGARVLVLDLDPQTLGRCRYPGVRTMFGDAEDPELIGTLPLHSLHWVISTLPHFGESAGLVSGLEMAGYDGKLALTAHDEEEAHRLQQLVPEATILRPFEHGVGPVVELVEGKGRA